MKVTARRSSLVGSESAAGRRFELRMSLIWIRYLPDDQRSASLHDPLKR